MKVLYWILSGTSDATRVSIAWHIATNGSLEIGDEPTILLAGDGTEYLLDDAMQTAEGVGVPPLRELVAKARAHEIPVNV
jgi:predicted peroxiredoxin